MAIATSAEARGLDPDEPLLVAALAQLGVVAEPVVWDDEAADWPSYELVVVRSTWDYAPKRDAFVAWARRVEGVTRLANAAGVIDWNTDKRYLRDLADGGVPVVPTTWVEPGDAIAAPADEVVVKPAVSAGSKDTARYAPGAGEAAAAHVSSLTSAGRVAMVQPYLGGVDVHGETALLYVGGVYSHAIRKAPLLVAGAGFVEGLFAAESIRPRDPSPVERAVAEDVLDAVPFERSSLLYARVDLVPGTDGEPLLLELELTEPSMFLEEDAVAPMRLALGIADVLS